MRQRINMHCTSCGAIIGTKMGIPDLKGSSEQYLCISCSPSIITADSNANKTTITDTNH